MKQDIIDIIRKFHLTNEIKTYDQCAEEILRLFSVVGQSEQLKAFLQEIENDKTYILNGYYKNKAKRLRESL